MSLFEKTTQELRREIVRLTSVSLSVPTEEGCARAVAEQGESWHPKASLVIELEPMSFRRTFEDSSDVNENLPLISRIPITYGSEKNGLLVSDLPAIRQAGYAAIPKNSLITLDRNLVDREDKELWMPYQRWAKKATIAGLDIDVDATTGQFTSADIGKLFVIEMGMDRFPGGDTTYGRYMNYIVAPAPKDFVALPVNEREVTIVKRREVEDEAGETTATGAAVGISAESLRAAFEAAGLIGKAVSTLDTPEAQQIAVSKGMRFAPILGTKPVTDAADNGNLIKFAVETGAIVIDDAGVLAVA